ncbi:MAG: Methyltransferase type 11, partial [Caulobacter sp.]|nr:Methyltransferase type 11 [Caulobacter sp.]
VWLGSVFTHLLAADQAQFAREIARVLKPGGTSVISYYLIDDLARANAKAGLTAFDFAHALDGCWTATPDLPESVIGYDFETILAQYDALGFDVVERKLGVWRDQKIQDQDILVARKR